MTLSFDFESDLKLLINVMAYLVRKSQLVFMLKDMNRVVIRATALVYVITARVYNSGRGFVESAERYFK